MDEGIKVFVGLDVHKDTIAMAVAETGRVAWRLIGQMPHDVAKLLKALARLGEPSALHVVYEAGPTGYGLQRALAARGYRCEVIAPSLIPKRAGERIKTDRRDCLRLAELSRAGQLRAVWIPDPADEAIRDLSRAREDAVNARTQARHQLKAFLLRHQIRYSGKSAWTKIFYRWLGELNFGAPSSQTAFTEYHLAVQAADQRVERLTQALQASIEGWRFAPVVAALQALRDLDVVAAIGLVAEIGDIARFDHPRKLMAYLGLVPSEHSSGDRVESSPRQPSRRVRFSLRRLPRPVAARSSRLTAAVHSTVGQQQRDGRHSPAIEAAAVSSAPDEAADADASRANQARERQVHHRGRQPHLHAGRGDALVRAAHSRADRARRTHGSESPPPGEEARAPGKQRTDVARAAALLRGVRDHRHAATRTRPWPRRTDHRQPLARAASSRHPRVRRRFPARSNCTGRCAQSPR